MIKILVLCTGNSCRSIITEGLLNHYGKDFFNAYSAGSHPAGYVHPLSIKTLEKNKIFLDNFKSQSWNDFSDINFDISNGFSARNSFHSVRTTSISLPEIHS